MRRRGFTFWQALGLLASALILIAILFPVFFSARESGHHNPHAFCQSNLRIIGLAFKQYSQDYNERLPPVEVKDSGEPFGWVDALDPYAKSFQLFNCPLNERDIVKNPRDRDYTDYWFNKRLSKVREDELYFMANTILSGDGNDGADETTARYSLRNLPTGWISDENSPAHRHLEGANYGFLDGHVKWFKPEKITVRPPGDNQPTFAVR